VSWTEAIKPSFRTIAWVRAIPLTNPAVLTPALPVASSIDAATAPWTESSMSAVAADHSETGT